MENVLQKLPLAKEELTISKCETAGETIRVSVSTSRVDRQVELTRTAEHISIETVDIGREVAEAPSVRTVGNVTIIPIVEEELVVTKRLILKQEIHLTRTQTETVRVETVPLRTEHAVVERFPSPTHKTEP